MVKLTTVPNIQAMIAQRGTGLRGGPKDAPAEYPSGVMGTAGAAPRAGTSGILSLLGKGAACGSMPMRLTARDSLARCGMSFFQASIMPSVCPQTAVKTKRLIGKGDRPRELTPTNPAASATTSDVVNASMWRLCLLSGSEISSIGAAP